MKTTDLKQKVIDKLEIGNLSAEEQDVIVAKIELLANTRIATALPELLSDAQYKQADGMRKAGKSEEEIVDWVEGQLPDYPAMMEAMILDIADELSSTFNDAAAKLAE